MLLYSAEAVLSIFGFNRSLFGFDRKKIRHWWDEIYHQHERDIEGAKQSYELEEFNFQNKACLRNLDMAGFYRKLLTDVF